MQKTIEKAKSDWLAWFENFCLTGGDVQVARMMIDSFLEYDLLVQDYQEME